EEAAFLAAIPSAPSIYINSLNSSKLLTKRNSILYQMYELGYITKAQLKSALSAPILIKSRKNKISSPYFSDEIFRIISKKVSQEEFFSKGFYIKTTMNKKIQEALTEAFEGELINFTKTQHWKGVIRNIKNDSRDYKEILKKINKDLPATINKITSCVVIDVQKNYIICNTLEQKIEIKLNEKNYKNVKINIGDVILCRFLKNSNEYEIYQTPEITGGAILMDTSNGDILGMVGGYSFDISPFNCITQAKRQPGSTIKPFVYAAALEQGMNEFDTIEDKPVVITLSKGEKYSPHNYNGKSYGKTPLRDGLIHSRNLSTVNLALSIGIAPISKLLKEAQLTQDKVPISSVLGSIEVLPINLLSAFSAFVNEGEMVFPRFIQNISQPNLLDEHRHALDNLCAIKKKKILSKETANSIKNMLSDTCKFGTASRLAGVEEEYGIQIGGKTGTTNNFKDAWFIGYFTFKGKTYLFCTFIGYKFPKSLGDHCSGARVALPVFISFLKKFIKS
ncbi:MAG: hypothetical protein LBE97_01410, partial [Holosporales bacterium]|nr:hypothetical protein [Holosporales bacterium]